MKCSYCGCKKLVSGRLCDMAQFGGVKFYVTEKKTIPVEHARVCTVCGNVMPYIDISKLEEHLSGVMLKRRR